MDHKELNEIVEVYTDTMNEVYRLVSNIMNEKVHQELTTDQFGTLRYLYKNEPSTSSDIAQEFGIGKSAVTAQINRLYERGFIKRERDETDRRVVYLSLTEEGKDLVNIGTEKLYDVLGEILAKFEKEEITDFIEKFQKLASILRHNN